MPYPAVFEIPTTWSETEFVLSWRSNCSVWSSPIINYHLEFRQSGIPRAKWIEVNVPAHETYDVTYKASKRVNNIDGIHSEDEFTIGSTIRDEETRGGSWSDGPYQGNSIDSDVGEGLSRRRTPLYRGLNAQKLMEYRQSYALKGLSRATNYEVGSKFEFAQKGS